VVDLLGVEDNVCSGEFVKKCLHPDIFVAKLAAKKFYVSDTMLTGM
jgi:hypothetical protein